MQRLHLRQWLILLLRALWIAMLVLALAMPFINKGGGRLDAGILCIDKSISTQSDADYIRIQQSMLREYDHWMIVTYDEQTNMDSLQIRLQKKKDGQANPDPNILWLTDFQDNEQNKAVFELLNTFSDRVFVLKKVKAGTNRAITRLALINNYDKIMNHISIACASNRPDENPLSIFVGVNGKRIGQTIADETGQGSYGFSKNNEMESFCTVTCRDDDYPYDNIRYMVINNFTQIKLLCVNDPADAFYHLNAFEAMDDIELTDIHPDKITTVDLNDYDMIWFSNIYSVNKNTIERLEQYSLDHPLLLTVARPVEPNDPWYDMCGVAEESEQRQGYLILTDAAGNDIPDMRIRRYFNTEKAAKRVLWSANNGQPILMNSENNRYLLLTPMSFKWNEIGLSPYFTRELGLIMDIMLHRQGTSYDCGDPIPLSGSFSLITTPTGEKHRVKDVFTETGTPGFYKIENGQNTWTVAVNIPSEECVQSLMPEADSNILDWNGEDIDGINRLIKGRNSQTIFFILAALFIILEMLLLKKGERIK